jgi:hypothetical protein
MNEYNLNGRLKLVIIMFMVVVVHTNASSIGRTQEKTYEELWINIPSCPLEFRMNSSKRYSLLDNRSSGRVVRYRLGCVSGDEANKPRVLRRTKFVDTDLEPSKGLINSISVHSGEMERCFKMNARLAVIEVRFKDGSLWKGGSN